MKKLIQCSDKWIWRMGNEIRKTLRRLVQEEDGIGTVEMILILVVIFTIYMGCK